MIKKIAALVFCLALCCSASAAASPHDIAKIGADAVIEEGTTVGDVAVIFGDLIVNGTISEDAAVIGGNLKVGPTGKILGDSAVIFGRIIKSPGAEINNNVVEIPLCGKTCLHNWEFPILSLFAMGILGLAMLVGFFVVFLLISLVFTDRVGRSSFYIQTFPWKSLLYGFASSILIVPAILLLVVSIIGIPVIPLFIIVLLAASFFGYATMCQLVGLKFFKAIKKSGRHMFWEVIVGFVIIGIVVMIPFVGWIAKTLVWMTGLGATVATRFGGRR